MKLVLAALHLEASPRALPLGPAMLASALKVAFPEQVQTRILDLFLDQSPEACADLILASDPDGVGFSMYVWNRPLALATAEVLKARKPGLFIFAGGAEATADPQGVLAHPAVDFVLPGEGEQLIVEAVHQLLQGADPGGLGLWKPSPIKDLSTLPSPFLDGTLDLTQYQGALWELSRGCPFTCDFCYEARGTAGTRRIPLARAEAELDVFLASGIREVFVLDPTFNYHKAHAKEILRLIAAKAPQMQFFFEVRSEFLDAEMAELFAALPCTLQIGLQSAHDAVLRNISRSFDPADFEAKILLLHQAGVPYGFDLIYGLPGDSLDGFRASLDFAMSLVPNHLDLFRLSVLPGTRLAETAAGLGLQHQAENPYAVTGSPGFEAEDLAAAARLAEACDVFYNHGKAVPWFDIILAALDLTPSELFERFAAILESSPREDLTALQSHFVGALFRERDEALLAGMAEDLIGYFGYSAELLDAPGGSGEQRVRFNHDPESLVQQLEAGQSDLEALLFAVPLRPCEAILRREADALSLEVVSG